MRTEVPQLGPRVEPWWEFGGEAPRSWRHIQYANNHSDNVLTKTTIFQHGNFRGDMSPLPPPPSLRPWPQVCYPSLDHGNLCLYGKWHDRRGKRLKCCVVSIESGRRTGRWTRSFVAGRWRRLDDDVPGRRWRLCRREINEKVCLTRDQKDCNTPRYTHNPLSFAGSAAAAALL